MQPKPFKLHVAVQATSSFAAASSKRNSPPSLNNLLPPRRIGRLYEEGKNIRERKTLYRFEYFV